MMSDDGMMGDARTNPKGVGYLPPEKGTAEKDSHTNFPLSR